LFSCFLVVPVDPATAPVIALGHVRPMKEVLGSGDGHGVGPTVWLARRRPSRPGQAVTARRGSVRHDVQLDCPPDKVWELVGDPARVPEWFPGIVSCSIEGDVRTIVTGSGLPMPEQLLTVDPVLRRFQYRITAPLFTEHLGTVDVHALEDGTSLVVYSTDANPAALALVIGGAARAALAQLPVTLGLAPARPPATTDQAKGAR
jgi:Polyketide cyclase / dehydrase and lipid transport